MCRVDEAAWQEIRALYHRYNEGWSKLSGSVRGRTIITTLSPKQREVAKLAAFGMKNDEIASTLHMSVSAVKQAISNVSSKTGLPRELFAAIL
jgi:DNA-binding NarL/FixJ family response regulator